LLVKIGFYRQELAKQAETLSAVDEGLVNEVIEAWFAEGDTLLKRAIWNAAVGSEEIPMAKQDPVPEPEQALAKMVDDAPDDARKAHILHKIASYTREVHDMVAALDGQSKDRIEVVVKAWLEADSGDAELRKNILDAEMGRAGHRIYGEGVQSGDVVDQVMGNASTHVGKEMDGSEHNADQSIKRTVPQRPTGEGAGKHERGNLAAPNQREGESPSIGS